MSRRIDARPRNRWDVKAGMRGAHLDMQGNVIGGYAPDGRGLGTKAGKAPARSNPFASMPDRPSLQEIGGDVAAGKPAASSAPAAPARPPALGGGLSRWEQMNPKAPKAFAAGSPANDKRTNQTLARQAAPKPMADGGKVNAIVDQTFPRPASPMPSVPGKMPAKPRRWDDPAMARRTP